MLGGGGAAETAAVAWVLARVAKGWVRCERWTRGRRLWRSSWQWGGNGGGVGVISVRQSRRGRLAARGRAPSGMAPAPSAVVARRKPAASRRGPPARLGWPPGWPYCQTTLSGPTPPSAVRATSAPSPPRYPHHPFRRFFPSASFPSPRAPPSPPGSVLPPSQSYHRYALHQPAPTVGPFRLAHHAHPHEHRRGPPPPSPPAVAPVAAAAATTTIPSCCRHRRGPYPHQLHEAVLLRPRFAVGGGGGRHRRGDRGGC